jgi:elongation factor Ts
VEVICQNPATSRNPGLVELAHNLALQLAAAGALALDPESLDPDLLVREREIHRQKTLEEGKPAHIADKIVEGRIQKFYQEVCLLEQPYIRDDKVLVKNLVQDQAKALGESICVGRFVRLQLGEESA